MCGVLAAERAILAHFKTVGGIFLVLEGIVVPLLALAASHCYLNAHIGTSLFNLAKSHVASLFGPEHPAGDFSRTKKRPLRRQVMCILTQFFRLVNNFCRVFCLFFLSCARDFPQFVSASLGAGQIAPPAVQAARENRQRTRNKLLVLHPPDKAPRFLRGTLE